MLVLKTIIAKNEKKAITLLIDESCNWRETSFGILATAL